MTEIQEMTEVQEKFIYMMEHSHLGKGLQYKHFIRIFEDATFTIEDLYHAFCLGVKFEEEFPDFMSEKEKDMKPFPNKYC